MNSVKGLTFLAADSGRVIGSGLIGPGPAAAVLPALGLLAFTIVMLWPRQGHVRLRPAHA